MSTHLSTCGGSCPGGLACQETADVVAGATDAQLRKRYGALAIDVACDRTECGARPGQPCIDDRTGWPMEHPRSHHGERAIAAHQARMDALN